MPVAIHCEPVSEQTSRTGRARYDGLPRRPLPLPPRNDKVCMVIKPHTLFLNSHCMLTTPCHREG